MTITLVSVIIAVLIGGIEAAGPAPEQMHVSGPFWNFIAC